MAGISIGSENDEVRGKNTHQREMLAISYEPIVPITRKRFAQSGFLKVFTKYWYLYCKHCSLQGAKYIPRGSMCGRVLRFCGYTFVWLHTFYFIYCLYQAYANTPIKTSLDITYMSKDLRFPGVAVCTINKISRRGAIKLATEISDANITTLSVSQIFDHVLSLGDLYDSLIMTNKNYTMIRTLLSKLYNDQYDITDLMESLTPQCSEIFMRCKIDNIRWNCSRMFVLTKTSSGFCCTFNYFGRSEDRAKSDNRTKMPKVHMVKGTGEKFGLSVLMNTLVDDYAYTIVPIVGWKVMVFNPADYPDPYSGGVYEVLISPLRRQFVRLWCNEMRSADVLRSYPIESRRCLFSDERNFFSSSYSYNECVTSCRVNDIWRFCKCRPFYYPRLNTTEKSNRTCNVQDIDCLVRYYGKTVDLIPYEDAELMKLIGNKEKTLKCNCYPECNDITYSISSTATAITPGYSTTPMLSRVNVTDQSILHVYFSDKGNVYLKQDEVRRWYEYISDAGGLCGLVIGFSAVSVVELIYFLILFLLELCGFPTETTDKKEDPNKKIMIRSVYWNEFYPRPRSDKRIYRRNNVRY